MAKAAAKEKFFSAAKATKKFIFGIPHFLKEMVVPSKVTWPTAKETTKRTGVVLVVSGVSAVIILLMDTAFSLLMKVPFLF